MTRPRNRSTKSSHACGWRARQRCKSWRSISESATQVPFEWARREMPCDTTRTEQHRARAAMRKGRPRQTSQFAVFYVDAGAETSARHVTTAELLPGVRRGKSLAWRSRAALPKSAAGHRFRPLDTPAMERYDAPASQSTKVVGHQHLPQVK